jgi:predicted nucleic acid-binding protein
MIAADSSALISFFAGEKSEAVERVAAAFAGSNMCLPPPVLAEMLSDPAARKEMSATVLDFPLLPLLDGYWERAGLSRGLLRQRGLKAKLGDALIAQSCIDHDVPLITSDGDFRHFAKYCGLKLA